MARCYFGLVGYVGCGNLEDLVKDFGAGAWIVLGIVLGIVALEVGGAVHRGVFMCKEV